MTICAVCGAAELDMLTEDQQWAVVSLLARCWVAAWGAGAAAAEDDDA